MATEFNRKITPTKSVILSEIYPDMYMGKQQTSNIGGGKKEQAYLSRFTLPSNPIFGSAELSRLDYSVYVNSIDLAENSVQFPEAAIYKTKDSKRLSLSEGVQQINDTKTKEILMFTSHLAGISSISENFDGTSNAGSDSILYEPVQRAVLRTARHYITVSNLHKYGKEKTWGVINGQDYTKAQIRKNYGEKAGDLGLRELDADTIVVPVEKVYNPEWKRWGVNISYEFVATPGHEGWKRLYIRTKHKDKVSSSEAHVIENTDLYGDEMTPSNTAFEYIRGASEFFGEQKKGESQVELLATGAARFSTKTQLTGGQAGELYTFWKDGAAEVSYPSLGSFQESQTGTGVGPADRQEVLLLKKNIPLPIKHPAKPYRRGAEAGATGQDANDFANNIEIDLNIKSLALSFKVGDTSGDEEWYTLRRAFVICFSEEPPLANETLFEFIHKHADKTLQNISPGGEAPGAGYGDARTQNTQDIGGATNCETAKFNDELSQDYGKPTAISIHAAGSGFSAGTYATDLYPENAEGWGSSGDGLTIVVTGSTLSGASIGASGNGYKVGDRAVVKNGTTYDGIVEITAITRKTKSFTAMAFLNTEKGMLISNSCVQGGMNQLFYNANIGHSSAIVPAKMWGATPEDAGIKNGAIRAKGQNLFPWLLDDTNKDILIPDENWETNIFAESMVDQWMRLNFLINSASGKGAARNSITPHAWGLLTGDVASITIGLDNMQGTIEVGDYLILNYDASPNPTIGGGWTNPKVVSITSQSSGAKTATVVLDYSLTHQENYFVGFVKPSTTGMGEVGAPGTSNAGAYTYKDGNFGRLLISSIADGKLLQRTQASSNVKGQFWALNSVNGIQPSSDLSKWTKHLSIWLCNHKWDASLPDERDTLLDTNQNTSSQVFIDKIEFKDFNYDVENPNFNERNINPDVISITADVAFVGNSETSDVSVTSDKVSIYETVAPTMLSIGTNTPTNLGWKDTDRDDYLYTNWTSDENAWLMLHNFKTSNLANMSPIPVENMVATYTHSGGDTLASANFGECYNTHYGISGFATAVSGVEDLPLLSINRLAGGVTSGNENTSIGLKWLHTGFKVSSSDYGVPSVTLTPKDAVNNLSRRQHHPIRIGDTIVFAHTDVDSDNVTFTVTNITQDPTNNLEVTLNTSSGLDATVNDIAFIQPEALVDNFSKKGLMMINPNVQTVADTEADAWAKRECGPASARVMEIVSQNSMSTTLKVDTVKPLLLDNDEQYICYIYGSDIVADSFTHIGGETSVLDATATNAKSGLYITDIDSSENLITIEWDGKSNSGAQMITEANLPALMISPWRYWIHMNIDCSDYASGAPTTALSSRTYDAFSIMDNNFPMWDGSTYHTAVLAVAISSTTSQSVQVDTGTEFEIGDTFMIDDEAMTVVALSGIDDVNLTVLRGVSGTSTFASATGESNARVGQTHLINSKLKSISVHSAWGENMSGRFDVMNSSGTFGSLAARRNLGSTYKEHLINYESSGGIPGAYINRWLPTVLDEGTIYETGTDFGFGSYSEDNESGGELARQILKTGEYNTFKMYDISNSSDFVVDNQLDLLFRYRDDTIPHVVNVNTRFAETNPPFALAVFKDELPAPPKLSVAPYKEDPFLPEFTWEGGDDDLWYGLLHIDSKAIISQYHNAILHLPLNEAGDHGTVATAPKNKSYYNNSDSGTSLEASNMTISGPLFDVEGLAGNCLRFDGSDDYVDYNPGSGNTFIDITDEFTFIFHIIPDIDIAGTSNIICAQYPLQVNFNASTSQIDVRVHGGTGSDYVELKSSAIPVDGETPTAIIVTFDKNLKAGNCKLFIDGRLEDQSGVVMDDMSSGANNNWAVPDNAYVHTDPFRVGHGSNAFDGRIEEVVVYNKCLYPVIPSDEVFVFSKPLKEISNSSPIAYTARLFVKDYHNIRGSTAIEVACSSPVSWRKSSFRLVD